MTSSQRIAVIEESQVAVARRFVAAMSAKLTSDETFHGQAAIVVTEMARNLVRHGKGGEIIVRQLLAPDGPALEMLALDRGPGLGSFVESLRDGFSTGGTAGTGLGAIKRLSDRFEVFSQPGRGTVVWASLSTSKIGPAVPAYIARPVPIFESSGVSVSVEREKLCGDGWEVLEMEGVLRAMVVDGLGHGPFAEQASREAIAVFRLQAKTGIASALKCIDRALVKTRGASGAIVELSPGRGYVRAVGVGNISMRLLHDGQSKSFGCDNGTLGAGVKRINEFIHPWVHGSVLVMHSDGISTRWNLDDYPGIARKHPGIVAGLIYRDFRRETDDGTVIVVRHQQ